MDFGFEQDQAGDTTINRAVIEPRVTADFFLTPHVSFGVYGAYNLIDGDGRSPAVGMGFTWHNRAFDGETSF